MNSSEALLHLEQEVANDEATSGQVADHSDPLAFSIARFLLVAALIVAPWAFGAVDSWAWMPLDLIACFVLLLWAVGRAPQKSPKLFWTPLYIPLALILVVGFIQYGARLAVDRWETRTALVLLASNLAFFFLSGQLFSGVSRKTPRQFGAAVLVFAGALGLFSILQFASGTPKIYWTFDSDGNFFGPYGNPDHYAGLMEMLIPVGAFYIAERRDSLAATALSGFLVMMAVVSLLLAGSRSGLLALSAEIVIAVALFRWHARFARRSSQKKNRRALQTIGATVVPITLAAALLFFWVDTGYVTKRLGEVASPGDAWAAWSSFRKSVALDSLHMMRDHPIFGVGLGNFEIAYPRYQTFPTDLTVDYAHNDYAQAVAETGLAGAALMLWALALFVGVAFRDFGQRIASGDSWIAIGAAVGCCGLLVHSFFDFNLHVPANAAWFAVLAAVALTPSAHA